MRHYNKFTRTETVIHKELIRVTCDRCNSKISDEEPYDTREFDLSFAKGSSYPDGGNKEGWEIEDLCDSCVGWLRELLTENDVRVTKIDVWW